MSLDLYSLQCRRMRGDLVQTEQILKANFDRVDGEMFSPVEESQRGKELQNRGMHLKLHRIFSLSEDGEFLQFLQL